MCAVRRSAPRLARISLTGTELGPLDAAGPDERCQLFLPLLGQVRPILPVGDNWRREWRQMPRTVRPAIRTYTVIRDRPDAGTIDVEIVLHGKGPGAQWAETAQIGDRVGFHPSCAEYAPPSDVDFMVLVGDVTALPAMSAIVAALPAGVRAYAFAEADAATNTLAGSASVTTTSVGRAPGSLLHAVRGARLPAGRPYVWVAGESTMVQDVRRHVLRERRFPSESASFMCYRRQGGPLDSE